jgi:hypothetical protein
MAESCDLCNEESDLIEGTFFKRSSHGGIVKLCSDCWNKLDQPRCALCGTTDLPEDEAKRHTVTENAEDPRGGYACDSCRNILDWNH